MTEKPHPSLRAAIFEIIRNQMRDGTPPETKQTLDRLIAEGHPTREAMRLIANVLLHEMVDMLRERRLYDNERYVGLLHALPRLAWDEEEEADDA